MNKNIIFNAIFSDFFANFASTINLIKDKKLEMKKNLFVIISLLLGLLVNAQASNFLFQSEINAIWNNFYNMKLPYDANVVNTIYQDSNGLIWIGTKRGLVNYNGYNYHLCYYGKNMPDENTVQALVQSSNFLYVGTDNGIRKLNLLTWKFESIDQELSHVKAVRALTVFDGKIWIGTRDEGLLYYDMQAKRLHKISAKKFQHKMVYALLPVKHKLFVGAYGGLNIYDSLTHSMISVDLPGLKDPIVNSLAYDKRNNCVWLGTDGKLMSCPLNSQQVALVCDMPGCYLKSIVSDTRNNRLLIGTETGMLLYKIATKSFLKIEHDVRNPQSLCDNLIYQLYQDKHNNLWIATDNGISMVQQSPLIREFKLTDFVDTQKGNLFTCILQPSDKELWLGGESGLLYVSKGKTIWYSTSNVQYKLKNNYIRAIYRDRSNQIWVATDGGVAKLNERTMQFEYCQLGNKHNNTNWVYGIYEDSKHRMWIATYLSGLIVVDKTGLENSLSSPYALSRKNFVGYGKIKSVYQMMPDNSGNLWANTNVGLICVNPLKDDYKLANVYLDNFVCDGDEIWFSDQGKIYPYDVHSQCRGKMLYQISYGSAYSFVCTPGRVWASSVDGIICIDKKTKAVYPYYANNSRFKCALFDSYRNRILFGGEDGVSSFYIDKMGMEHHAQKVYISAVSCDSLLIPVSSNGREHRVHLESFRNISLELASYVYSLQGESFYYKWNDDEWKKMNANTNLLDFPVMPSGKNVLKLSLTNPIFDKNAVISTYVLDVPYPWYLSIWAWGIYVLLFLSGIIFLLKMQRRKNERLYEQKAKEKTLELSRMKMEFFVNVSHELKTPLSLVIAPLGKLLSECTNAKMRDSLKGIQRNALKLNSLIYKIIDDKQTEYDTENSVIRSHIELVSLLNNCISSFAPIVNEKNMKVEFVHDMQELWLNVDVVKMESIFTNLLSNAIKHVNVDNGYVKVSLQETKNSIAVSVKDNGCGIPEVELPLVFIRHYQGKEEDKAMHGTGIGLFLVKKFVELHQGAVKVVNDKQGGAVFTIELPLLENSIVEESISKNPMIEKDDLPKVLVVDDNKEVVEFLCSALGEKYLCLKAFNGKEGLDVLKSQTVNLIVVDQMMPIMNGLEFVRNLKNSAQTANVPVIMLTAKDDFDTELQSIKAGVDVFISKPFEFNKLMLQIARLIKRSQNVEKTHRIETMLEAKETHQKSSGESSDELFVNELLKIIETNMHKEGFNVSMLSELMNVDSKQLYRKTKQLTGKTPVAFLRSMRLKRAAELLKQNRFSVSEVMYMVGMSNASYFTKCFTNEFGIAPKQFVQEHNKID